MALDFPSSPALNDTYTDSGKTWQWNGSGWQLVTTGTVTNADISATAEIAVSKLADGAARQLLQTDAAGTGVEWTSNVDVPGTLDVTGAAVFDSTVAVTGTLTKSGSNVVTVGDTGTVSTAMLANDAVTYAKIQNVSATDKLLGRSSAGAGDVEEITCTAAGRALLDDADAAAQRVTLGLGTLATQNGTFSGTSSGTNTGDQTITLTGDVTGSGTGSFATAIASGVIVDADVNANAEIAVSKLADGAARQLLQTDVAGTGVEWTSNVDIPGTLDVTGATTLDSTLSFPLGSAGSPSIYPGTDTNTGIWSSAADTLSVSTGGVCRVYFDSYGVGLNGRGTGYSLATPDWQIYTTTGNSLAFSDYSKDTVSITSNGYLRMASSTGGIQFNGDTASANAMDDYEEGGFTPTIIGTTVAGTGTYTTQVGRYTKIGNRVMFDLSLVWTAHTGTGNMRVAGLPFTVSINSTFVPASTTYTNLTSPSNTFVQCDLPDNGTEIRILSNAIATGVSTVLAMDTAATFRVQGTYEV